MDVASGCFLRSAMVACRVSGGQLQAGWCAMQNLFPVDQLALEQIALQGVSLPRGEISILDGDWRHMGGFADGELALKLRKFAKEYAKGPAVGDGMVHDDEQDVIVG